MNQTILKGNNTRFIAKPYTPQIPLATIYQKPMQSHSRQTVFFDNPPIIMSGGSVVARREANGPIGAFFDYAVDSDKHKKNFEQAEIAMLKDSINIAVEKSGLTLSDVDMLLAGDLLNQLTTSNFTARDLKVPFLGLYSACSTYTQSLALGACLLNAGYFNTVACATASHFATAERQYRSPLEYGAQRPPFAQWTVTGAGCTVLGASGINSGFGALKATMPHITSATFGKVIDFGIDDVANMGVAMAPAALDTLITMLGDTGLETQDFDLIVTGDLGKLGSDVLRDLSKEQGVKLAQNYTDCGAIIYDKNQMCYQGGSGAGCSAVVFNGYLLDRINNGYYKRVALLATGALMSPQSAFQGETIPAICHGVIIEN